MTSAEKWCWFLCQLCCNIDNHRRRSLGDSCSWQRRDRLQCRLPVLQSHYIRVEMIEKWNSISVSDCSFCGLATELFFTRKPSRKIRLVILNARWRRYYERLLLFNTAAKTYRCMLIGLHCIYTDDSISRHQWTFLQGTYKPNRPKHELLSFISCLWIITVAVRT